MTAARWARDLLEFFLPAGCVACGRWMPGPDGAGASERPLTCPTCRTRLRAPSWPRCPRCHVPIGTGRASRSDCRECVGWDPALRRARYAYLLEPPADALVHGLKYGGWPSLASEMGRAMAESLGDGVGEGDHAVVVPVPTTVRRIRRRGYNQAALLADEVARCMGFRRVDALSRTRGGPTQVALPPSRRRANVRGAFSAACDRVSGVEEAHVVLVDDVLTTGSTAGAAAAELDRLGARDVTLVTFARALPFRRASAA
ncbi:MAG: phosphoribosyltransferase family protein [Longimicrobiales bacterium]